MTDFLKGNFSTKNKIEDSDNSAVSLEDQFEMEALKKLGGSIAFVSKKKVMWDENDSENDQKD